LLFIGAANSDPAQFPEPDRLDISRRENKHVAFGHGIHLCIGAPLARLEAEIAINTILRRFPTLQLLNQSLEWEELLALRKLKWLRTSL
jgi:cytochrome P450